MFVVDAGDFAWKSSSLPPGRVAQQRRKGQLILDAYALSGMDGVVPGDGDLALGVDWLVAEAERAGVPMLAANLACAGAPLFPPARRVERDGVSIGVVGIVGEHLKLPDGCSATPAVEAAQAAVAGLGPTDALVLLSHADTQETEAVVEAVASIDLVVSGSSGAVWPHPQTLPGDALHFSAGSRGKKLGLAAVALREGASGVVSGQAAEQLEARLDKTRRRRESAAARLDGQADAASVARTQKRLDFYDKEIRRMTAELDALERGEGPPRHVVTHTIVELGADVADHAPTAALLDAAKAEIEQAAVAPAATAPPVVSDGPYVGSQVCSGCHPGPAQQWATTGHARAWTTLVQEQRTQDLDCYRCHVTGAFHAEGPQAPAEVAVPLRGVGCESCHGPGRAHATSGGEGPMVRDPGVEVCVQCHDGEQDGGRFHWDSYRPKVAHGRPATPSDPGL